VTVSSSLQPFGEQSQLMLPASGGPDRVAHGLPPLTVAGYVAMFQLDTGAVRPLGDEAHLDLARLLGGGEAGTMVSYDLR
jgi:hypothetical protein